MSTTDIIIIARVQSSLITWLAATAVTYNVWTNNIRGIHALVVTI